MLALGAGLYGLSGLVYTQMPTLSSVFYLILLGSGCLILLFIGLLTQFFVKKYSSRLSRAKEDKSELIKFAFTFGFAAQMHLNKYKVHGSQRTDEIESQRAVVTGPATFRRVPQPEIPEMNEVEENKQSAK